MYDFDVNYSSRKYLDIAKLRKELSYVPAPPGIYRFKGKDYFLSIYRKGKTRPNTLIKEHETSINAFSTHWLLTNDIINIIGKSMCSLYGCTKQAGIHEVI